MYCIINIIIQDKINANACYLSKYGHRLLHTAYSQYTTRISPYVTKVTGLGNSV